MTQPYRRPFPRWAKCLGWVTLLALAIYLVDAVFVIPSIGSSALDRSRGLTYRITITTGGGRSGAEHDWYVGYWAATFHHTMNWIAGALLLFTLPCWLYFKLRDVGRFPKNSLGR
jgi:hypothetical protein